MFFRVFIENIMSKFVKASLSRTGDMPGLRGYFLPSRTAGQYFM